jgi:hypothetical protein
MRVVRNAFWSLLPTACLAACGPALPSDDTCAAPQSTGVASIAFLSTDGSGASVADLQAHQLIFGPQGGSMVELRFGLQGDAVPSCANMVLSVARCTNLACTEVEADAGFDLTRPLQTYAGSAGRSTKNYLMQIPYDYGPGALISIKAQVGGVENSLRLWLEQEGPLIDAGPGDAGSSDADFSDADFSDADLPDAMSSQ